MLSDPYLATLSPTCKIFCSALALPYHFTSSFFLVLWTYLWYLASCAHSKALKHWSRGQTESKLNEYIILIYMIIIFYSLVKNEHPSLVWRPCSGNPSTFLDETYTLQKLEGLVYRMVKLHNPYFNSFWLIHPCDGQTDGQAIAYRVGQLKWGQFTFLLVAFGTWMYR